MGKPMGADDTGIQKIDIKWDSGSSLRLLDGIDDYEYWWEARK
jgi:hypothetical protein